MINRQKALGIAGAALVLLGMFLPIATISMTSGGVTFFDSLSWWDSGAGFVVLLLFLIAISMAMLFTEHKRHTSFVGGFVVITIVVRLIYTIRDAAHLAELEGVFAQAPAAGTSLSLSVNPLGWVVMLIGAGIIIYSGFVQQKRVESAYRR